MGLRAVLGLAIDQIGDADLSSQVEGTMSNFRTRCGERDGYEWENKTSFDLMIPWLMVPVEKWHMGNTGEVVDEKNQLTR